MQSTILLTVVGPTRSVDLEVPGELPVGELIPKLLLMCGPQPSPISSQVAGSWSLGLLESKVPLDVKRSLIDAGILDGAMLMLSQGGVSTNQQNTWQPTNIKDVIVWSEEEEDLS